MKRMTREDLPRVLDYLRKDLPRCLYLYADLWVYGLDNPHMAAWLQEDGAGLGKVAMEYHGSFQLYGDRDFEETGELLELIRRRQPPGISARREIIEALAPRLPDYTAEYGVVLRRDRDYASQPGEGEAEIRQAGEEDVPEIAALICADPEMGEQYTPEGLAEQLRERMRTGMGRSFVIRRDGRIAAHVATFAECPEFLISSGLVVHPDYRDSLYFYWLDHWVARLAAREGKDQYGMVTDPRLLRAFRRDRRQVAAEYGKLSRKPPEAGRENQGGN